MLSAWSLVLVCALTAVPLQDTSKQWQSATILDVKEHQGAVPADPDNASAASYDVSLQVKDTVYVLFFTPPPGVHGFQYTRGMDRLVLVRSNTITLNDIMGRAMTLPIIDRHAAAPPTKR